MANTVSDKASALEESDVGIGLSKINTEGTKVADVFYVQELDGRKVEGEKRLEEIERQAILRALEASGGNRRQAAGLLGISLRTLFYKMRRLPVH